MKFVNVSQEYFYLMTLIILGRMREVDAMLGGSDKQSKWLKSYIYSDASDLVTRSGLLRKKTKTLYRGILINLIGIADRQPPKTLKHREEFQFASFSLDPQVACWFADPKSFMNSGGLTASFMGEAGGDDSHLQGYVLEYAPDPTSYLWHPEFENIARIKMIGMRRYGEVLSFREYAQDLMRNSPELYSQFEWNLKTQQEVIIKPFGAKLKAHPIKEYGCASYADLNNKFTHPDYRDEDPDFNGGYTNE